MPTRAAVLRGLPPVTGHFSRCTVAFVRLILHKLISQLQSLQVAQLKLTRAAEESEYSAVVGGNAVYGGKITGPKWTTMSGELREGKMLVANFESYTNSGRGLTTCRSVDSLSESTADMIVEWLRSPSLAAQLK